MAGNTDGGGWTYYEFGARDSYEQIFAFIGSNLTETYDILGETRIFPLQSGSVAFPVITVDPQRVPLPCQQLNAETVRSVQVRVEGVYAQQLRDAVADGRVTAELITQVRECLLEVLAVKLVLAFLYGIPSDSAVPGSRVSRKGVITRFPELGRIDVSLYDLDRLILPLIPSAKPPE